MLQMKMDGQWNPIHWASCNGHTEIVKILAPLTDNSNAPDGHGLTPIILLNFSVSRNKASVK